MLRESQGFESDELREVLQRFGLDGSLVKIRDFDILSPDSFAWIVQLSEGEYCLYAEDYVASISDVREAINEFSQGASGNFVPIKASKQFDELSAVRAAEVYKEPDDFEKMQPYVTDSGVDLVFLFKLDRPNRWQI